MRLLRHVLVGALLLVLAARLDAATINLAWDPNTETDLGGYVVRYGTASKQYTASVDVGNVTTWSLQNAAAGTTYYFVVEAYNTGGLRSNPSNEVFATIPSDAPPGTTLQMTINRNALAFAAVQSGGITTSAQSVSVNFANGTSTWTATTPTPWLEVVAGSGSGAGMFNVRVRPGTYSAGVTRTGTVTVTSAAANSPVSIPVTFRSHMTGANPSGMIDTPANNATGVVGALPLTGWAIDDVEVKRIRIWRDPIGAEGTSLVFVGDALFVDGSRPDVDAAYELPFDYRAGWGLLILTNMLPNQGNGTFRLHVYAEDADGHNVLLGTRTITCDNAHATKPFGSIDTPGPGEVVSGTNVLNFGWVLTPQPNYIPFDGSTLMVYIDGVPVGRPTYGYARADIASLFPGLQNSSGPVGLFQFDSTQLTNGVHTISWGATDSAGNAVGIGSRFFTVMNATASPRLTMAADASVHAQMTGTADQRTAAVAGAESGQNVAVMTDLPESATPSYVRSGFDPGAPLDLVERDWDGARQITTSELGRLALTLGAPVSSASGGYEGYLVSDSTLKPLPSGAFLDRASGEFFWQPGAGYVGKYELLFVRTDGASRQRIPVVVTIEPK